MERVQKTVASDHINEILEDKKESESNSKSTLGLPSETLYGIAKILPQRDAAIFAQVNRECYQSVHNARIRQFALPLHDQNKEDAPKERDIRPIYKLLNSDTAKKALKNSASLFSIMYKHAISYKFRPGSNLNFHKAGEILLDKRGRNQPLTRKDLIEIGLLKQPPQKQSATPSSFNPNIGHDEARAENMESIDFLNAPIPEEPRILILENLTPLFCEKQQPDINALLNIPKEDISLGMYEAHCQGKHQTVDNMFESRIFINLKDNSDNFPLGLAAFNNDLGFTRRILTSGAADINCLNNGENTALIFAAEKGHIEIVRLLLEHNADKNHPNTNGSTAINYAAGNGHLEIVKLLLKHDARTNHPNKDGNTALIYAAKNDHLEIAKLLLEHGADKNHLNKDENTALNCAAADGNLEMAKLLLKHNAHTNHPNKEGNTPLIFAATNGHPQIVKLLLEHGADKNHPNKDGNTPLTCAATNGHLEIVKLLLEHGADKYHPNKEGKPPLTCAAEKGHLEISTLLLEHDADKNYQNKDENIAITFAAAKGRLEIVKLLLKHGADKNHPNKEGNTPLILAAENGHLEVVKLLLKRGAKINHKNQYKNIKKFLRQHGVTLPFITKLRFFFRRIRI